MADLHSVSCRQKGGARTQHRTSAPQQAGRRRKASDRANREDQGHMCDVSPPARISNPPCCAGIEATAEYIQCEMPTARPMELS